MVVYTASLSAVRLLLRTEGDIRLMSISFFLSSVFGCILVCRPSDGSSRYVPCSLAQAIPRKLLPFQRKLCQGLPPSADKFVSHASFFPQDLSQLGRRMEDTIIIDNSPASYIFHPANAVPISSWFNDPHDTELIDLCPFLTDLADTRDVRAPLNPGL